MPRGAAYRARRRRAYRGEGGLANRPQQEPGDEISKLLPSQIGVVTIVTKPLRSLLRRQGAHRGNQIDLGEPVPPADVAVQPGGDFVIPPNRIASVTLSPCLGACLQNPGGLRIVTKKHLEKNYHRAGGFAAHGSNDALSRAQSRNDIRTRCSLKEFVSIVHGRLHNQEIWPLRNDPVSHNQGQWFTTSCSDGRLDLFDDHTSPLQSLDEVRPVP
mmetsp:Transcript_59902/g.152020  ORF Transcript_59902/g.152020 Transcript_59902/m.152020 type:complete len:215 (-) Transcript_59902:220-864(-)